MIGCEICKDCSECVVPFCKHWVTPEYDEFGNLKESEDNGRESDDVDL